MSTDLTHLLKLSYIFNGISNDHLETIANHPEIGIVKKKKGEILYRVGEIADRFWIIISGQLSMEVHDLRKPFRSLATQPGHITGIKGLLQPGAARPVTISIDEDAELIEIPSKVLQDIPPENLAVMYQSISIILLDHLLSKHQAY
ncbi:cyclic nucleotide-binding protein [Magnetococcus marinus MC-1]|uniref:Cyclic nucleotide-binding protein n=1 Tax=Magnetococcus marinus (strain ATCC BAA-1437 / JCM 17883 / MC-1) TaxID=156889 RepID=A0L9Y4_MAGMM|nr:cyclic nucleotide-binding domain-containing protein [Magnetococcus marinus]ABK44777.1 cyclic nucleotide-binding protein [Magnetococcus marinus MC-1]